MLLLQQPPPHGVSAYLLLLQAMGRYQRKLAQPLVIPADQPVAKCHRAHRLAPTALALTSDDTTAFTVAKDGTIFKWDVETCRKTSLYRPGGWSG